MDEKQGYSRRSMLQQLKKPPLCFQPAIIIFAVTLIILVAIMVPDLTWNPEAYIIGNPETDDAFFLFFPPCASIFLSYTTIIVFLAAGTVKPWIPVVEAVLEICVLIGFEYPMFESKFLINGYWDEEDFVDPRLGGPYAVLYQIFLTVYFIYLAFASYRLYRHRNPKRSETFEPITHPHDIVYQPDQLYPIQPEQATVHLPPHYPLDKNVAFPLNETETSTIRSGHLPRSAVGSQSAPRFHRKEGPSRQSFRDDLTISSELPQYDSREGSIMQVANGFNGGSVRGKDGVTSTYTLEE